VNGARAGGFTLLELILSLSLLGILVFKASVAISTAAKFTSEGTSALVLEDQARLTLDRIAYAIMGSDRDTLIPEPEAPLYSEQLDFRTSLGIQNGQVVWDDPERIGLGAQKNQLTWFENPETLQERRIVWSNGVRPFLEGEIPNGVDDNGNGLVDEKGLSFVIFKNMVTIRLTLGRQIAGGTWVDKTVETKVTCRNPASDP
jgi:prepilin-type N-terminal cleavage/methylation domain-containing protein